MILGPWRWWRMREYRLQIPSGRAWVLSCESSIVQKRHLESKG